MEKEIYDEPLLIDEIINHYYKNNKLNIKKRIINKINQADKIYIIACGSSYYSGNLGKYYFEHFKNKPVEVILASEALYDFPLVSKKPLFIFISQSGETLDVINVIKLCKEKNYYILGITNSFNSKNSNITESYNTYTQSDFIFDTNFFTQNLEIFSCLAFLSDGEKILTPQKLKMFPYFK